jgi:hypothetical protein
LGVGGGFVRGCQVRSGRRVRRARSFRFHVPGFGFHESRSKSRIRIRIWIKSGRRIRAGAAEVEGGELVEGSAGGDVFGMEVFGAVAEEGVEPVLDGAEVVEVAVALDDLLFVLGLLAGLVEGGEGLFPEGGFVVRLLFVGREVCSVRHGGLHAPYVRGGFVGDFVELAAGLDRGAEVLRAR